MESTSQPPNGNSDRPHEDPPAVTRSDTGETWDIVDNEAAPVEETTAAPRVSLFSPNVPAVVPLASSTASVANPQIHVNSPSPSASTRSLPSLANLASMTKRFSRQRISEEHLPIVPFQPRIDRAQKSADDPTTASDSSRRRRTTVDLMMAEHATRADINTLFSDSAMPGSRAPSYNNATGPLHSRGIYQTYEILF